MKKNYLTPYKALKQQRVVTTGKSLCFKAFVFLLFVSNSIFAQDRKLSKSPWDSKNLRDEIVNKRSRTAKHFVIENGSKISAFISPSSIHFMEAGKWENINTEILSNTKSNNATHPYTSERNSVKTDFPINPFNDYILMKSKEGSFKEKISAIKFVGANNAVLGILPVSGNVSATVHGNRISYSGFYPNVSLEYSLGNDQRKFNLVIHSSAFLNSIPAGATSMVIEEEFESTEAGTLIQSSTVGLSVFVAGQEVLGFAPPEAFDSNTTMDTKLSGVMSVQKNQNTFAISTAFPLAWIKDNSRVFPILLDPTVNYYPQLTNFWTGYQTSAATKTSGYIRLTTGLNQGWGRFDLATLPSGASVTGATYYGNHYSTTGTTNKIALITGLGFDPLPATAAALSTGIPGGTVYNNNYVYGTTTYGWNAGILGSAALNDIANAAGNWIALGFSYVSGETTFMYHYGVNGTTANICYIEVTYFTTPCTGAPGANAVTPASFTTCPSYTNPAVSVANTYTVGGLTYQWYSSTVSVVGLYSAIPGATLNTAPTPTLGVTTWYQVVATCTNPGGLSTTLTPAQFTVSGATTNNIPYFEGFEGLQADYRLPNCSWLTNNLGTSINTYTSSRSDNRVPYDGNSFASFGLPATNQYVYTNGLNMNAGITYSASIMYATEYTGGNNWTELSLWVGSSQSPAGLVQIASVSPAVSGAYKQLSGLFTVPSSGLYYVAIKATGASGTALYLSWDNLEVTIPCEGGGAINSPTLIVTANTQTICEGEPLSISASGADTYTWSTGANTAGITENPTLLGLNNYTVEGTNALTGCVTKFVQPITVIPSPLVLVSAYPATVCVGEPVVLSTYGNSNGVTYLWSNGMSSSIITVTTSAANNYTVIATGANGCSSQASQAVAIYTLPIVGAASSIPGDACNGDMITLTGSGAVSYEWISDTSPALLQGSSVNVSPTAVTIYTIIGTSTDGCTAKSTITQNVVECVGIKEHSGSISGLMIYPNPTSAAFTVELNTTTLKTIEVIDLTGRVVLTNTNAEEKTNVNISSLANGIYYVKVKTDTAVDVIKVVKH